MRQAVLKSVKNDAIKALYQTLYNVLLNGTNAAGTVALIKSPSMPPIKPGVPKDKINSIALSAVATMEEILNDVVEMLLPIDFNTIMSKKLTQQGLAENPQIV
jgi:hypothetical protein